jgi:hypothetical protein
VRIVEKKEEAGKDGEKNAYKENNNIEKDTDQRSLLILL